jgi:PKD repeat protein
VELMLNLPLRRAFGAAVGLLLVLASSAAAEPRPYIFSMGHFLAAWADQPWSYDAQAMDKMVEMGATGTWIDFPWAAMEAAPGVYNWDYADHQVDQAEAHGLEMFAFVGTTPDWAKLYAHVPAHRTPPAEEYLPAFHAFHSALAARYAGRVRFYQFWNEPSGCGWINEHCANGHDCELFTIWQQRAYDALKAGNPDCVVSAGGFDGDPAGYVQCMYSHGGQSAFDAISVHPYGSGGPGGPGTSGEGIDYSDLTQVRDVMVANGDGHKKIWITEYGWSTTNESQRAEDLLEVLTELKKPQYDYVSCAKHLVLNDWTTFCCYGLTDPWFNPKPAFDAFKNFDKSFPQFVDFAADVTLGRAPLTVQFTDQSSMPEASEWFWEFGDGATSTEQHPAHTYTINGTFTVRLTVTGMDGPLTAQKPDFIRVGVITEIVNPSYEDEGNFLAGWSYCLRSSSSLKHNPGTGQPTPRFHDGISSVGMSSDRPGDQLGEGALWQEVAVVPRRTYRVNVWASISSMHSGDDAAELRVRDGNAAILSCANEGQQITANSLLLDRLETPSETDWHLLTGEITATQDILTIIAFWDYNGTEWGISSLHLDDWSISDVTPPIPADFDADTDVDMDDFGHFQACQTGAALGPPAPGCADADLDGDADVDQSDFGLFQRCISGPSTPADPGCMP